MRYLKTYLLLILTFLFTTLLSAQTDNTVRVKLIDSQTNLPVDFATVYLISEDSTSTEKLYALTDKDGRAIIENVKSGSYIFKTEMMGYFVKEIPLKMIRSSIDLGEVSLQIDVNVLDKAVVTAVGNPITIKKDTIEYNATSFKTTDGDMLEDLLKKLPGVEVSSDGTVTVNGEEVKKIKIDGKTFFVDDPKIAMSNIPAKIINKVKVIEEKSDQAKFTGIDDGQEQTIIDLSINPGMMRGWFGSVTGGGGMDIGNSDDLRWQGSTMTGRFTEDNQLSIIGNGNNTNDRGFNEMAGAMNQRQMINYGLNSGITTSWMGGVNANGHLLEDDAMKIAGNYLYSGSEVDVTKNSIRNTFIDGNESLKTTKEQMGLTLSQGHRGGAEMDYEITEKSSILFRPYFDYNFGEYIDSSKFSSENSAKGLINDGYSASSGETNSWNTNGMLLLRQKIGDTPGRTISASINYSLSESGIDELNKSLTKTYLDPLNPDENVINQMNFQDTENYSLDGKLSYTEPLGKNYYMEASYSYRYNQNNADKKTYDYNENTGSYNILNNAYSSSYENSFINQKAELRFMKQEDKYNVQLGFNVQPVTTISVEKFDLKKDSVLKYSVVNFAPSARIKYEFSKTKNLSLYYDGYTSQPSITQLQPVPDNSNPLYIKLGNPSLQPKFQNTLRAYYRSSNRKTFSSVSLRMYNTYIKDDIVNATWYNSSGVQYTAPINSEAATYSSRLYLTFNSPIAKSNFSASSSTSMRLSSGLTYTGVGEAESIDDIINDLLAGRTTSMTVGETLKLTYRNDHVEAILGGRASYSNAWYTIQQQKESATWTNTIMAEVSASLPWGMEIKTDADYKFFIGFEDGYGDSQCLWNAEISQLLFNNQATIRFKIYDILNEATSIYRATTDNYIEDVQTNTLGRYCMLTFTYRFGKYNNQKMGGEKRRGGPGGPGGPGPGGPGKRR